MLAIKKIDSIEELKGLKTQWDKLLDNSPTRTIFQTFEWQLAWWETIGIDKKLYVLAGFNGNELIGIAPMMIDADGILKFIGTPNSDYNDFVTKDTSEFVPGFIEFLNDHHSEWSGIELNQIREDSETLDVFREHIDGLKGNVRIKDIEITMAYRYDGDKEKQSELEMPKWRNLRNSFNYFDRLGGLEFEYPDDAAKIQEYLPLFYHSHIVRWQGSPTPSKFEKKEHRDFYRKLVRELSPQKRIYFSFARHGDIPFSYLFTYAYEDTLYLYTITNDLFHQRKSPGIVLFHRVTEKFVREGFNTIDYARGAGTHKVKFINTSVTNYQIKVDKSAAKNFFGKIYDSIKQVGFIDRMRKSKKFQERKLRFANRGFWGVLADFFRPMFNFIYDSAFVTIYASGEEEVASEDMPDNFEYSELTMDDMELLAAFYGFSEKSGEHNYFNDRFDTGARAMALIYNGMPIAIGWIKEGQVFIPEIDRLYETNENEQLLYDFGFSIGLDDIDLERSFLKEIVEYCKSSKLKILAVAREKDSTFSDKLKSLGFLGREKIGYRQIFGIRF